MRSSAELCNEALSIAQGSRTLSESKRELIQCIELCNGLDQDPEYQDILEETEKLEHLVNEVKVPGDEHTPLLDATTSTRIMNLSSQKDDFCSDFEEMSPTERTNKWPSREMATNAVEEAEPGADGTLSGTMQASDKKAEDSRHQT